MEGPLNGQQHLRLVVRCRGGDFKYKGNTWSSLHMRASLGFSHNLRVVPHNLEGNSSRPQGTGKPARASLP